MSAGWSDCFLIHCRKRSLTTNDGIDIWIWCLVRCLSIPGVFSKGFAKRFAYATVVLDVSYECFPRLREEINVQPHLLLLTGVARGGSGLRLEMRARNIATAMLKDVDGVVGAAGPVVTLL